ncbi:MAG TPA: hypothetical protein VGR28_10675, partial [Candidatus Thermoplasmatota archaeon]|nr:hypothetical protein [Candidatus Thermoplasmatota archaeon]
VEVGFNPDPSTYEALQRAQDQARWNRERHALLVTEHRPRGEPATVLCTSLLTTLTKVPRCTSLVQFLSLFEVEQVKTLRPPPERWQRLVRRATGESARRGSLQVPILVQAKRGTRQGLAVAPLHWFYVQERHSARALPEGIPLSVWQTRGTLSPVEAAVRWLCLSDEGPRLGDGAAMEALGWAESLQDFRALRRAAALKSRAGA